MGEDAARAWNEAVGGAASQDKGMRVSEACSIAPGDTYCI